MMSHLTIAFTGGGTAGHVFPAFPVIERLRREGSEVFWIGSVSGMERKLVEEAGISYRGVPAGKLRRYWSWKNFTDIFSISRGFFRSLYILRQYKPDLLFSKGGFVSVPPVAAARLLKIPVITHESDVDPGLATRLNLKFGAHALLSYEKTMDYLPAAIRSRARVVGNPVRESIFNGNSQEGKRIAGLLPDDKRPIVLVLGGSQGSHEINALIEDVLDRLLATVAIVHQTGAGNSGAHPRQGYFSQPFFYDELPHVLAAADLVVARSGAGTVWELAARRIPAIFVPLREASRGDQILNAQIAEEAGTAITLDAKVDSHAFASLLESLVTDVPRMEAMRKAASRFPARNAADRIVSFLQEILL